MGVKKYYMSTITWIFLIKIKMLQMATKDEFPEQHFLFNKIKI